MATIKVLYDQYEWKKGKGTVLMEFVLNTETGKTYWREAKQNDDYYGDNVCIMSAPW